MPNHGEVVRRASGSKWVTRTHGYSEAAFRKLAEDNLEQHHFVGLAEEPDRSLELLLHTFDSAKLSNRRLPAGPGEVGPEATESVVRSLAGYDWEFYEFGRDLFQQRWSQMLFERAHPELLLDASKAQDRRLPDPVSRLARMASTVRRRIPFLRRQ